MGQRYGLCVGINRYKNAKAIDLPYSVNDAQAVGQLLADKHRGSFDLVAILLDEQATKSSILASFNDYLLNPAIRPDDLIIFFFSGYAIRDQAGDLCLVPYDVTWGGDGSPDSSSVIYAQELAIAVGNSRAKNTILLVDGGYSGVSGKSVSSGTPGNEANLFIIGATLASKPAYDTSLLKYGIFTECLLRAANAVPDNGEWLTIGKVLELATTELMNCPDGQLVQGTNHSIDSNISLFKNPSYSMASKIFTKGILHLFDLAGYKRVMPPQLSDFKYPNFFMAALPVGLELIPKIAVLCLDNSQIPVTQSHITQFITLAQQLQAHHGVSEAIIITQHSLSTQLRRAIRASNLCTWSTQRDLLRGLIGLDRRLHQLLGQFEVNRPNRQDQPASTKSYFKVKANSNTRNGAK